MEVIFQLICCFLPTGNPRPDTRLPLDPTEQCTGGNSCPDWTFRCLATKPNMKKNLETLNFFFQYLVMKSMCHFAAKIPAPHDHSNMLRIHAGPRNPPVRQSLAPLYNIMHNSTISLHLYTCPRPAFPCTSMHT